MDLTDRLKAMAEGGHDALDCPPGSTKPPLKEHDCWKAAAEIERLKAELDETVEMFHREVAARIKLEAHNATMQTALEDMVTAYGGLGSKPVDFARQALAPDAGKPILKVVTTGIEWWRTVVAFAIDPEVTEDDVGLAERRHMDAISALNASREIGLTQAAPLPGGSAQEPPAS